MVMFGTKWPSMTSDVNQVGAPTLGRAATASPRRAKVGGQNRRRKKDAAQRLTSREIGLARRDLKPRLRILTKDDAGGHARIDRGADNGGAEAAVRATLSAARSPVTPIKSGITYVAPRSVRFDEKRHAGRPRFSPAAAARMDDVSGKVLRSNFRDRGHGDAALREPRFGDGVVFLR